MTIVADASFLVPLVADGGSLGAWCERLVETEFLVAPHLVSVEATNILRRLQASGELSSVAANLAYADLLQLDLELFPFVPFAERIWELRGHVTSYDAWYVALAEALEAPLATLDRRLANTDGVRCTFLVPTEISEEVHE